MYGHTARHHPEQFFSLPAFDTDSATPRYAAPAPRYDDSDADALAFFSLTADDSGAGE